MDTPRDIRDRIMKNMLSCPRVVRDLLALLPTEWTAAVDAANLRELPTEFIGARGEKRIADLCWLAEGGGGDSAIILIENQSTPDRLMPARATTRVGLLYESLGSAARGAGWAVPAGAYRRGVYGTSTVAAPGRPERPRPVADRPSAAVADRSSLRAA